jgi:hypothetical protein
MTRNPRRSSPMPEPQDTPATLTDDDIETRPLGALYADTDTSDTGDDSGDTSDTSDTGDDSGDTGDDSGDTSDSTDTGDDSGDGPALA